MPLTKITGFGKFLLKKNGKEILAVLREKVEAVKNKRSIAKEGVEYEEEQREDHAVDPAGCRACGEHRGVYDLCPAPVLHREHQKPAGDL